MIDPITAISFSVFQNKGTYALLLGSGLSRAASIPTGWEITLDLVRRLGLMSGAAEQTDWAAWYRAQYNKEPNYSDLLAALATTPDQRRAVLHSYIEPTESDLKEGRKIPTKAHKAIAQLVKEGFIRVVITTNFDRLLENALREIGVEPTVIKSNADLDGAVPLTHAKCYIVKLHGDYLDTRIKNTEAELSSYSKKTNRILDRILDEFGLIVCGWSADWDRALTDAILRAPNRRYSMYWLARGRISDAAKDLIATRLATVINIDDAEQFFETLQRNVETQAGLKEQDPRSTQLLVANAKRLMTKPEDRIHLEELIGREIRHLNSALDAPEFDTNGGWSNERFQTIVNRYEVVTEPAARLFGVLGRWGSGTEFKAVVDVIRNLATVESRSGLVVLNNLRTYPARVLLFSYGIGLLKSDRYADIYRLFLTSISRRRGQESTVVESLVNWDGDDKNVWNLLQEFPEHNRKTPLSDHFHSVFSDWVSDYLVFPKNEYTRLFEGFELLGALAFIQISYDEDTLDKAVSGQFNDRFVWAPIGRASWDGQTCRQIFEEWRHADISAQLIAAGFARASSSYLDKAIKNFENLSSRLRW